MNHKTMHMNIRISGWVQGVGFRYAAFHVATGIGIKGFVQNHFNGEVYIEAEGDKTSLDTFIKWCHNGPSQSRVDKVSVSEGKLRYFSRFDIHT